MNTLVNNGAQLADEWAASVNRRVMLMCDVVIKFPLSHDETCTCVQH